MSAAPDDLPPLEDADAPAGGTPLPGTGQARKALGMPLAGLLPPLPSAPGGTATVTALADVPRPRAKGLGLDALFTPRAPDAPPVEPVFRASVAATLSAPQRLEAEWVVTVPLPRLHYVDPDVLGLHGLHDLATAELLDAPQGKTLTLKCSQMVSTVAFPGPLDRSDEPRCPACCGALGYPAGDGSPQNDEACTPELARRIEKLA